MCFLWVWYNNSYVGSNVAEPLIEPRSKPDQQRGMQMLKRVADHQQNRTKAAFRESGEDVALPQALSWCNANAHVGCEHWTLLFILAEAQVDNSLLDDFLASSGYHTPPCSFPARDCCMARSYYPLSCNHNTSTFAHEQACLLLELLHRFYSFKPVKKFILFFLIHDLLKG